MSDAESTLLFAETLIHEQTDTYCSELQRRILIAALQGERKTYDQIAEECGYSPKYVKQDVAPKLWQILTRSLNQKISKANVRSILEQEIRHAPAPATTTTSTSLVTAQTATGQAPALPFPLPDIKPLTASNILLVDDQPKNLRLLSDLLEEEGYEVQQAINGTVALQAAALAPPDLILLDIHMPDMDGYTVCQRLKSEAQTKSIPVIFVSASDEAWDKVKAFSSGGSDYITKPFKVVEVLARVENQLKVRQLQQALRAQNAQLRQAIQELQRLAALDELTQVASRHRFDAYLLECWQQAVQHERPIALMFCQVDNFNFYCENGSPECSDHYLYQIAEAIKQAVQGPEDLVSRYGTLTFAVVLPKQTATEVKQMAQTLLEQVEKLRIGDAQSGAATNGTPDGTPGVTPDGTPGITLSIGAAMAQPDPDVGLESFLEECDHNLHQAKSNGGNCVVGA